MCTLQRWCWTDWDVCCDQRHHEQAANACFKKVCRPRQSSRGFRCEFLCGLSPQVMSLCQHHPCRMSLCQPHCTCDHESVCSSRRRHIPHSTGCGNGPSRRFYSCRTVFPLLFCTWQCCQSWLQPHTAVHYVNEDIVCSDILPEDTKDGPCARDGAAPIYIRCSPRFHWSRGREEIR